MSGSTHQYSCDQLGVCQDRPIRCRGCKPSEGTRTAELILGNNPASLDEFYRYPRTLEEAFGPGHRYLNDGPAPMDAPDRIVVRASGFAFAFVVALSAAGVLA